MPIFRTLLRLLSDFILTVLTPDRDDAREYTAPRGGKILNIASPLIDIPLIRNAVPLTIALPPGYRYCLVDRSQAYEVPRPLYSCSVVSSNKFALLSSANFPARILVNTSATTHRGCWPSSRLTRASRSITLIVTLCHAARHSSCRDPCCQPQNSCHAHRYRPVSWCKSSDTTRHISPHPVELPEARRLKSCFVYIL